MAWVARMPTATDLPFVPAGNGPRAMAVSGLAGAALGAGLLVPTVLAGAAGLVFTQGFDVVERQDATVTGRAFHEHTGGVPRSSGSDSWEYDVVWDDGTGSFSVCATRPLADMRAGDRIDVLKVPWSSEVVPDTYDEVRADVF